MISNQLNQQRIDQSKALQNSFQPGTQRNHQPVSRIKTSHQYNYSLRIGLYSYYNHRQHQELAIKRCTIFKKKQTFICFNLTIGNYTTTVRTDQKNLFMRDDFFPISQLQCWYGNDLIYQSQYNSYDQYCNYRIHNLQTKSYDLQLLSDFTFTGTNYPQLFVYTTSSNSSQKFKVRQIGYSPTIAQVQLNYQYIMPIEDLMPDLFKNDDILLNKEIKLQFTTGLQQNDDVQYNLFLQMRISSGVTQTANLLDGTITYANQGTLKNISEDFIEDNIFVSNQQWSALNGGNGPILTIDNISSCQINLIKVDSDKVFLMDKNENLSGQFNRIQAYVFPKNNQIIIPDRTKQIIIRCLAQNCYNQGNAIDFIGFTDTKIRIDNRPLIDASDALQYYEQCTGISKYKYLTDNDVICIDHIPIQGQQSYIFVEGSWINFVYVKYILDY